MILYCGTDFQILLDLTGSDNWNTNEGFLAQISLLAQKKSIVYVSNIYIEGILPESHYNFVDSVDSMTQIIFDDMDTDQSGILIISNNIAHIRRWIELGFNTVLLTDNWESYKEWGYMPDEVWNYNTFNSFVDNTNYRLTYTSEKTGFPNIMLPQTNLIRYSNIMHIPHTNYKSDVIFTGRYFTLKDNRNYNHPLSRAIIGFKNNLSSCVTAVKRTFGQLIDSTLMHDSTVSHITFVPPRPNKNSRFMGLENFVRTNRNLEYDLLFSINDYPSPKKYSTFVDKYQCVYGNIGCKRKIAGHVLLIDDVFTSGATTAECARVLYKAGANKVTILPLAFTQVVNYHEQSIMPVIFDSEANEYFIGFRNNDSGAYWYSKNDNGVYNYRDFHLVNKEYLEYHGYWSTKLGWTQEYTDKKEVKAIIFDLDNTLIHTDHLELYRQRNIGIENLSLINKGHIIIDPSLLKRLKHVGIRIGVVTSSPRNYAIRLLSACQYPFDYLVAAKDTLRSKPSPDPLLKCALKLKVNPEYVLNIGDQLSDIEAGNNARMMNLDINTVISTNVLEKIIYKKQGLAT
ncbi:HAD-IA family hydrolase [Niallia sp. MER 6]|uniref:HAD-IA family hydrolase n=1 Tax=Niallia sp. MER 6 TaxID=2939567 RepID=UPI002041FB01|nr:HAD-IA family hydrolase [Niallia sp. MER 6]MCM3031516.1 HAD-IA family hydrolase [Niallia sp. MER 6]